jgi:ATP-dependent Zn protease
VTVRGTPLALASPSSGLAGALVSVGAVVLVMGVYLGGLYYVMRRTTEASHEDVAKRVGAGSSVTFADVAGVDGAKLELQECLAVLQEPQRFRYVGAW